MNATQNVTPVANAAPARKAVRNRRKVALPSTIAADADTNPTTAAPADDIVPANLVSVADMAKRLKTTTAHMHSIVNREKPKVYGKEERAFLYSSEFLESLLADPAKTSRRRRVKVIIAGPAKEKHEAPAVGLFERIEWLEAKVKQLDKLLGV